MKFLGREYTLWLAALAALVNWLVGFQFDSLNAEQAAWINTVANAIAAAIIAWRTRPIAPNIFTYAASSIFGLIGAYGLHVSQEQVATFNLMFIAVLALYARGQVSPSEDARRTGVLGNITK